MSEPQKSGEPFGQQPAPPPGGGFGLPGGFAPPGGFMPPGMGQVGYAASGVPTAAWPLRAGAAVIDGLILAVPINVLSYVLVLALGTIGTFLSLPLMFAPIAYYIFTMTRPTNPGQTIGKQVLGIKVIRDDGGPIDISAVLMREVVFKGLVCCGLGACLCGLGPLANFLYPLFNPEGRAGHDLLAKTRVVPA